jgi:alanine racemase
MANTPPATLRLAIDHDALASNWRALDRLSGDAKAGAAVKANAYGLGVQNAVPTLVKAGCEDFYVAHWSEVSGVAEFADPANISVLHGPLTGEDAAYAVELGVKPVINSLAQAKRWIDAGGGRCDLMVDTGINRLGLSTSEINDPILQQLDVDTLMSHLASADEDSALNAKQLQCFTEAVSGLPSRRLSLANSAGIALGSDYAFDLTRPGLSLYGGVPRAELAQQIKSVATPQATIMQVRKLTAGDSVGYNATFTAKQGMRVGIVSLGYADGYLRTWSGKGVMRHSGGEVSTLGRVSMDMIVVDLSDALNLGEGDWLDVPYDLPTAARTSGLSQYELLTILGQRFTN